MRRVRTASHLVPVIKGTIKRIISWGAHDRKCCRVYIRIVGESRLGILQSRTTRVRHAEEIINILSVEMTFQR